MADIKKQSEALAKILKEKKTDADSVQALNIQVEALLKALSALEKPIKGGATRKRLRKA